jgi:Holliday junction resolvase RusA-like endonuclease
MINFIYYGEIRGKGRPRFRNAGKFIQTYTDQETQNYEASIKEAYLSAHQETFLDPDTPLRVRMKVYHQIPKSVSKKKRNEMLDGKIRPTKKPDIDNILKSVFDSLNQVAFYDDTQIIEIITSKYYAEMPRLEIEIERVDENA